VLAVNEVIVAISLLNSPKVRAAGFPDFCLGSRLGEMEGNMSIRPLVVLGALLLIAGVTGARLIDQSQFPPTYMPSGEQTYKQYCAACHGADAKGSGPVASLLKTPPPNLTTLARRHGGRFPYGYVLNILEFGPGLSAHGSSDMPTWGPVFQYLDKQNERVVQQRIKNLCNYLASLQEI
jgi:mono/diheme cytochrome c family protein